MPLGELIARGIFNCMCNNNLIFIYTKSIDN